MDLKAFLSQNAAQVENVKIAVSSRFKDKDGKPMEWEIRALSMEEDQELRDSATVRVPVPGKRGVKIPETNIPAYILKVCAHSVVFPDLLNAELQDSYGAKTPEELLKKMLLPGEYATLNEKVQEINGFDLEAMVEEVKN